MTTYFCLREPDTEKLLADTDSYKNREIRACPIGGEHLDGSRRVGHLEVTVKHNRRTEEIIWCWVHGVLIHEDLLSEFEKQGFTGYRSRSATVRFRDGTISHEYRELVVTGWAGVAMPESGVTVNKSCPACHWKSYTALTDCECLIDWTQWSGEDFFMVWPLPNRVLITERVAYWLLSKDVKSFRLTGLDDVGVNGFTVSRLSNFMPEDLAIKYGRPLGLE